MKDEKKMAKSSNELLAFLRKHNIETNLNIDDRRCDILYMSYTIPRREAPEVITTS